MTRGEIYRLSPPAGGDPKRSRCYAVVSRQTLLDSKADRVVCAPVNSTFVGLETQLPVGVAEGLKQESCINCDQLVLIERSRLTNYIGSLDPLKLRALRLALRTALDVE
jgi:mRNA interferase MazF